MGTSLAPSSLSILLSALLAVACATDRQTTRPRTAEPAAGASRSTQPPRPAPGSLYAADEALRDVLSGPWEYVGTGAWPGINRMQACAFRNARVYVVNVYCTITEAQAFRLDVFSPERGRVRIYAESAAPVSAHARQEYFTFTVESGPPPGPEVAIRKLTLGMSFEELRAYDERRYEAFLPSCYGGTELSRKQGGCLGALAPRAAEWAAQNRAFLEYANNDWHRVLRDMRSLAVRYGREPE